jgi:ATP-dependent DNA helicase RecG
MSAPRLAPIPVESSLLRRVSYDGTRRILQLEFHSGAVYQYFDVPPHTYDQLIAADSKGCYLNHSIRDCFSCHRVPVRR